MSPAPLDYETPRPTDIAKRRFRRFAKTVFLVSLTIGVLLALGWTWAVRSGSARHARWVIHLKPSDREVIAGAIFFAPLLVASELISRARKKVDGPEMAALAAEERLLRDAEKIANVGWKVPKYADGEFRKVAFATIVLYAVTFVLVLALTPFILLLDRWKATGADMHEGMSALQCAFYCANVVGIGVPALFILMLPIVPRTKVTLISHGVLERFGGRKRLLIAYSSIRAIRIEPSRRRRSLKCIAVRARDEQGAQLWHRFDLGHDAPIGQIVEAFEAKGLSVTIDESGAPKKGAPP